MDCHTGFRHRSEDRIQCFKVFRLFSPPGWIFFIIDQHKPLQPPRFSACRHFEENWIQSGKPVRRAMKLPYFVVPIGWYRWVNSSLVIDFPTILGSSIQIVVDKLRRIPLSPYWNGSLGIFHECMGLLWHRCRPYIKSLTEIVHLEMFTIEVYCRDIFDTRKWDRLFSPSRVLLITTRWADSSESMRYTVPISRIRRLTRRGLVW